MSIRSSAVGNFAYLTTLPEVCGEAPAATRPQLLQLSSLTPKDFERLCYRMTRLQGTVEQCRLYGVHGQVQHGIDLYARRLDGSFLVVQCKRSSDQFTPGEITEAVDTFLAGDWAAQATEFVLAVTANLERTQVVDRIEEERPKLTRRGITFTVWDQTEMSALLKDHPRLVDDFFGREAVRTFLGDTAADALKGRLDAVDMIAYRSHLGRLYREVFRGLERGVHGDDRTIPLDARFVLPDVVVTDSVRPVTSAIPAGHTAVDFQATGPSAHSRYFPDVAASLRNPTALPRKPDVSSTAYGNRVKAVDWLAAGAQHLVMGAPGAGKSALLRMVVLDALADEPHLIGHLDRFHDVLPVWLPFAFWTTTARKNSNSVSVLDAVHDWLNAYDHGHLWPLIEKALDDERVLLVVDGLDEWASPDLARLCLNRLEVFASTKHAGVLASSRPFSSTELPVDTSRWRMATLAPLDHEQRLDFIAKWLTPLMNEDGVGKAAAQWAEEIGSSAHLRELSDLPLFLSLLLRSREQQTEFPEDLHAVLSEAISRLIGEHRRRKIDTAGAADQFPTTGDIRKVSAATAEHMHTASMITITDDELRDSFRRTLADAIGYPAAEAHAMARALVNALSPGVGLMVRPAPDETSFFHRSALEFLAAERLLTLADNDQAKLFRNHLTDRRWSQVLRFLIRGFIRPPEITAIFDTLDAAATADPLLCEAIDLLAADVAVGAGATDARTRRRLLDRVAREIETGEREAHRAQLLDTLVAGLSRREMRSHLAQRFGMWLQATSRETWSSVLKATHSWESDDTLLGLLWHAMLTDNDEIHRTAGRILGLKFVGDPNVADRLAELASTTRLDHRRAAATEALSLGWPDHLALATLIDTGHTHPNFAVRHASIAADLRRGNTTDSNRKALIDLLDHAPTISTWSDGLMELMFEHFPDDQTIFDHYVRDADPATKDQFRTGEVPSTFLILKGYTGRPEARDYFLKLISPDREDFREHPELIMDRIPWTQIVQVYGHDAEVVAAVQALAREHLASPLGDSSLYICSLIVRTDWMRDQLIARSQRDDRLGLGWLIRALIEGWPDDPAVRSTLTALVETRPEDIPESVIFWLSDIITDPSKALDHLADIAAVTSHHKAVVNALKSIIDNGGNGDDPRIKRIVERVLSVDMSVSWKSLESGLYHAFPEFPKVRELALSRLAARDTPLEAIAHGFRNDAGMRQAIAARFRQLNAPLRGRLIEALSDISASDDVVTDLLSRYDAEPEQTVKILAATGYTRRLKTTGNITDEVIDMLTEQARSGGEDYHERRAAAFCALAELDRLDILADLRELYGHAGQRVQIQHSPLGNSSLFHRYVCRFWNDVKVALGSNFTRRFGYANSSDNEFLQNILAVAHDYPDTHDDLTAILSQRPELAATAAGISYMWRTATHGDEVWEKTVALLTRVRTGSYFDIRPAWPALQVLTEEFADDPRTTEWLDNALTQVGHHKFVQDGKTYIATPSYGVIAAIARLRPNHPLVPELLAATVRNEGEPWHTFYEWSELAAATVTGAQEFVDLAAEISRVVHVNDLHPDYIYQPLTARLRRDTNLAMAVGEVVPNLPITASGIAIRLLALSGQVEDPLTTHLHAIAHGGHQGMGSTFDPFTGDTRHIELLALDILDTVTS